MDDLREKLTALIEQWEKEALSPAIDPGEAACLESCADELRKAIKP
ncbi:hypothetical protein [Mycobacteroides abscessus]